MRTRSLAILAAKALLTAAAAAQGAPPAGATPAQPAIADIEELWLDIYSDGDIINPNVYRPVPGGNPEYLEQERDSVPGRAVVHMRLGLAAPAGSSLLQLPGLAAMTEPSTLRLTTRAEQLGIRSVTFRHDAGSRWSMLEACIGRPAEVVTGPANKGLASGTLVATSPTAILTADGLLILPDPSASFALSIPADFTSRPTLRAELSTPQALQAQAHVTYETASITWWANYDIVYRPATTQPATADLAASVTILNRTGADFSNAHVRLIAGEVNQARTSRKASDVANYFSIGGRTVKESSLAEYRLYMLPETCTIPEGGATNFPFLNPVQDLPIEKLYTVTGPSPSRGWQDEPILRADAVRDGPLPVAVDVILPNNDDAGPNLSLPGGRVRVYQSAGDGEPLVMIGEDNLDPTPAGEELSIRLGEAFDLLAGREQKRFEQAKNEDALVEVIELKLTNHRDKPAMIVVTETLFRTADWTITQSSAEHERLSASKIRFKPTVQPGETVTITYTVRYTW